MTKNKKTLWTSSALEKATAGRATTAFEVTGVSIDTRTLEKGDLFIALKGDALDGHDYVEAAFKAGAGAALVRRGFQPKDPSWPLVFVDDTMKGLEDLGRAGRARSAPLRARRARGAAPETARGGRRRGTPPRGR